MKTLNECYCSLSARRRYEVWFIRLGLVDGSGAWWFRYLLLNPGRDGCANNDRGKPVQVWATWFPRNGDPKSFIQGFGLDDLHLSARGDSPLEFHVGDCGIGERSCHGKLKADGQVITWDLRYTSTFRATLSNKGWIGFSRTPHSDACFSGQITVDGQEVEGDPLGFGLQGHNCGYRHRNFWTWSHAYFPAVRDHWSTLEALVYEMPFGLVFRKAVLWHAGKCYEFRKVYDIQRDREQMIWKFHCSAKDGTRMDAELDGRGPSVHRLPYVRTDCSGVFEVANNSLARAVVRLERAGRARETLETNSGAVLEMVGEAGVR